MHQSTQEKSPQTQAKSPQPSVDQPTALAGHADPLLHRITQAGRTASSRLHAALLDRSSHRTQQLVLQMQRQYGNRYVQRVMELSRKGAGEADATPEVEAAIEQARGGGRSLDAGTRVQMESAFGTDFSGVRLHTDSTADNLNQSLSARAFTTGQDIFFRQGEYNPDSSGGKELLAHELTHVVQQTGTVRGKLAIGQPDDQYEQEADRVAASIIQSLKTGEADKPLQSGQHQNNPIQRLCSGCADDLQLENHRSKPEAAYDTPVPQDDEAKIEDTGSFIGASIGGSVGGFVGSTVGGFFGQTVGSSLGATGASIGGQVGAFLGSTLGGVNIAWSAANYTSDNTNGSSTTVETPFNVNYRASADRTSNVWRLQVASITGSVNIHVRTGGSRDPVTTPPTSEAEARDAVTVMKGYYARGSRGAWHTEAASKRHEEHHYREWKCSSEHYWPTARVAIETMTAPLASYGSEADAITGMRSGATGADAKIQSFRNIAHSYWFTLADNASSRPYAAGQLALNSAVQSVQALAATNGWTVPQGTDSPSPEPPCYAAWLPYTPP